MTTPLSKSFPLADLTERVIGGFFTVHHSLGYGFLEPLYRKAMAVELDCLGLRFKREVPFELLYKGVAIGSYRADLIVESQLIVEAKAGLHLDPTANSQVLTYLKATGLEVGLILHFGPKPVVKRVVASKYLRRPDEARQ